MQNHTFVGFAADTQSGGRSMPARSSSHDSSTCVSGSLRIALGGLRADFSSVSRSGPEILDERALRCGRAVINRPPDRVQEAQRWSRMVLHFGVFFGDFLLAEESYPPAGADSRRERAGLRSAHPRGSGQRAWAKGQGPAGCGHQSTPPLAPALNA
jgi:hypothetical protein